MESLGLKCYIVNNHFHSSPLSRASFELTPQKLQFCALPNELSRFEVIMLYGEIGNRTLTSVMQTQNTNHYMISPTLLVVWGE